MLVHDKLLSFNCLSIPYRRIYVFKIKSRQLLFALQEEILYFFVENTIHYSRSKKIKFHDEIDHDIVVLSCNHVIYFVCL
jgi:hypothetical protein